MCGWAAMGRNTAKEQTIMRKVFHHIRTWAKNTKRCSPAFLLVWAILILAVFFMLHLFGLRENMCVLSGTFPQGAENHLQSAFCAMLYLIFYMSAWLIAPILIIASVVFFLLEKIMNKITIQQKLRS
jgi:hypothetical protein